MQEKTLQLDPRDNVLVALSTLEPGTEARYAGSVCPVAQTIPAKQKMALAAFNPGDLIVMYGMVVGEVVSPFPSGGLITTRNIRHRTGDYSTARQPCTCRARCIRLEARTFMGYHRADGQVGTRNYWIVVPLVFCENRNVEQMREALEEELGYGRANTAYRQRVRRLIASGSNGSTSAASSGSRQNERAVSPISTASAFSPINSAAAARARMRRHSALCSPATSTTPTSQAQLC